MCENRENLCEPVINANPTIVKREWRDEVYLADSCKERFLTTTDIPEFVDEGIFMAGIAELVDGYHVERFGLGVHSLLFTLEGRGLLTTSAGVEVIEPNSLVILPATTSFRFELDGEKNDWKMNWVLLLPTPKWRKIADLGQTILPYHRCEQVASLFNLIHYEIDGRPSFRRLLVSEVNAILTGVESKLPPTVSRVYALFNQVESQLHLPWSVKDMASRCFISEEQFNRITKRLYNMSPRARLIHLRMEKATVLLEYREWTVAMIALRLGYRDPYNFTHRFKKHFGCSPTTYRKNPQAR